MDIASTRYSAYYSTFTSACTHTVHSNGTHRLDRDQSVVYLVVSHMSQINVDGCSLGFSPLGSAFFQLGECVHDKPFGLTLVLPSAATAYTNQGNNQYTRGSNSVFRQLSPFTPFKNATKSRLSNADHS